MKRRFIDLIVIVAMAIIANYPMYQDLKSAAEDMDVVIQMVQSEIISVQESVYNIQDRVEFIRIEVDSTVNSTLNKGENILKKLQTIEAQNDIVQNKVDKFQASIDTLDEKLYRAVKGKFKQPIPGLPGFPDLD